MNKDCKPKLISAKINNLFGDRDIAMKFKEGRPTFIHGRNGTGKSSMLRMVETLFNHEKWTDFIILPGLHVRAPREPHNLKRPNWNSPSDGAKFRAVCFEIPGIGLSVRPSSAQLIL